MFRLLIVLATVLVIECSDANAQGRIGRWFRSLGGGASIQSRSPMDMTRGYSAGRPNYGRTPGGRRSNYPSSSLGFSIGVGGYPGYGYSGLGAFDPYRFDGYGYDPYRYGSFKAPDLLNDPYFRERYRYDSRFPGRYRAPLVVRPTAPVAPAAPYKPYRDPATYANSGAGQSILANPTDLARQLQSSSGVLARSLSAREGGEVWMEFLAPKQISRLIETGDLAELRELLTHYDGIVGSSELRYVAAASGFTATRNLLRQYVNQNAEPIELQVDEPTIESLPLPESL